MAKKVIVYDPNGTIIAIKPKRSKRIEIHKEYLEFKRNINNNWHSSIRRFIALKKYVSRNYRLVWFPSLNAFSVFEMTEAEVKKIPENSIEVIL